MNKAGGLGCHGESREEDERPQGGKRRCYTNAQSSLGDCIQVGPLYLSLMKSIQDMVLHRVISVTYILLGGSPQTLGAELTESGKGVMWI